MLVAVKTTSTKNRPLPAVPVAPEKSVFPGFPPKVLDENANDEDVKDYLNKIVTNVVFEAGRQALKTALADINDDYESRIPDKDTRKELIGFLNQLKNISLQSKL